MASAKPIKPSATNVSKLLAGEPHYFQKSTTYPSAIRGWKKQTTGFVVSRAPDGCTVEHHTNFGRDESARLRRLEEYKAVLGSRFAVTLDQDRLRLVVKAQP